MPWPMPGVCRKTVQAAPEALQTVRAVPENVWIVPETVRAEPWDFAQDRPVEASRGHFDKLSANGVGEQAVRFVPHGQPMHALRGIRLETARAEPKAVRAEPETARAERETARAERETARAEPEAVLAEPETVRAELVEAPGRRPGGPGAKRQPRPRAR